MIDRPVHIRPARPADRPAILAIIMPTIREGVSYTIDPASSEEDALAYWLSPQHETFVAEDDGAIVGTFYLKPNQAGGGRHVCNCGYMTARAATGRGVARSMCLHSIELAKARGYRAMQFNFVVSTNTAAIHLWQDIGFAVVGRLTGAFAHPVHGDVDALVMYMTL